MRYILSLLFLLIGVAPTLAADDGTMVMELSGKGSRNTRPFTVKDHWEIRWKTHADGRFTIEAVKTDAANMLESLGQSVGAQDQAGTGETYIDKGGRYYLSIASSGEWSISVVQLP